MTLLSAISESFKTLKAFCKEEEVGTGTFVKIKLGEYNINEPFNAKLHNPSYFIPKEEGDLVLPKFVHTSRVKKAAKKGEEATEEDLVVDFVIDQNGLFTDEYVMLEN